MLHKKFSSLSTKSCIRSIRSLPSHARFRLISSTKSSRSRSLQHILVLFALFISAATLFLPRIQDHFRSNSITKYNTDGEEVDLGSSFEDLVPFREVHASLPVAYQVGQQFIPAALVDVMQFERGSLSAILPVTNDNIDKINGLLALLFSDYSQITTIGLVCKAELLSTLQALLTTNTHDAYMDIFSATWREGIGEGAAVLEVALKLTTEYVLIMGSEGLMVLDQDSQRHFLTAPLLLDTVTGFCGGHSTGGVNSKQASCVYPDVHQQNASFLLPPFVLPSFLLHGLNISGSPDPGVWIELGLALQKGTGFDMIVQETSHDADKIWCKKQCLRTGLLIDDPVLDECLAESKSSRTEEEAFLDASSSNSLAIILPTVEDLNIFAPVACQFARNSISLHVLVLSPTSDETQYQDHSFPWLHDHLSSTICEISYSALHSSGNDHANAEAVSFWLKSSKETMSTIIYSISDHYNLIFEAELEKHSSHGTSIIRIPRADLPFCDWIGSLSIAELRNWKTPEISISVITDDRPKSLARLIRSLENAHYFGDSVNIRINMEQTSDVQTHELVEGLQWIHGQVYIHHRVVHAGLLTAIVESWYPQSNDSYGVLLEDDVEVSPLFYAWLKMAILRYRYGDSENRDPSLFGVSLYQQKQTELRPEGRRPFDAQRLFDSYGLYHRDSPYISQVPCSWGAVYFPEHWREFHSYLTVRFSEAWIPMSHNVVPHVRSNRWAKSWKRYFIEMVFLRGYVMLYPNYDNFLSLSTNHLEIGSHVKEQPRSIYDKKKALFTLPLMVPSSSTVDSGEVVRTGLLKMPNKSLPSWSELPVLDLLGTLSSSNEIRSRGFERRKELAGCRDSDIWNLSHHSFIAEELFSCKDNLKGKDEEEQSISDI